MLVKRYHANDMQQAMDTVTKELGSDAVILSSSKVRKKGIKNLFSKPVLEVMVAYDPKATPSAKKRGTISTTPSSVAVSAYTQDALSGGGGIGGGDGYNVGPHGKKPFESHSDQVDRLDKRIDSIDNMLSEFLDKFSYVKRDITYDYPEDIQELLQRMIESQVREELAHSLAKEADLMLRRQQGTNASEILEHLILEKIGKSAPIQHKKFTQKVILVIGPTGVGKTTSIVKLSAEFSVKQRKKVGIINTDTFRIGAQEQLQTYADILDVPLQIVYQLEELDETMAALSERDIIFIDTAGKKPSDEQHREDLLDIIKRVKPEDILLCISATTSYAAIKEIIDAYSFLGDYKLLMTKVDETKFRGNMLNVCWYAQKPLAYVTTGQNVPDDIEILNPEAVTKEIINIEKSDEEKPRFVLNESKEQSVSNESK